MITTNSANLFQVGTCSGGMKQVVPGSQCNGRLNGMSQVEGEGGHRCDLGSFHCAIALRNAVCAHDCKLAENHTLAFAFHGRKAFALPFRSKLGIQVMCQGGCKFPFFGVVLVKASL